jgi:hypothetical protein
MPLLARLAGLSALAAAGVLLAVALPAQGRGLATTTDTTTDATAETTTLVSTVEATTTLVTTLEQTTTHQIVVPTLPTNTEPTTTEAESSSDNGTATWIWVLLAILGVGLIVFAILLARRGGSSSVPVEERRRRLDNAVGSWVAQGWAIESQDADSAVLRRVDDLVLVHVDAAGHVSARPFGAS